MWEQPVSTFFGVGGSAAFRGVYHGIYTSTRGAGQLWDGCWLGVQKQGRDHERVLDVKQMFNVEACFMSIKHINRCYCYWDCMSP